MAAADHLADAAVDGVRKLFRVLASGTELEPGAERVAHCRPDDASGRALPITRCAQSWNEYSFRIVRQEPPVRIG